MKKWICLVLSVVLALSLTACGGKEEQPTTPAAPVAAETQAPAPAPTEAATEAATQAPTASAATVPVFAYKGIEIPMNALAQPIVDQLGEPKSFTEEASCAYEGMDRTYFYGSFYLQTYAAQDGERVQSLWIVDDTITTPEGVYIGMNRDGVAAAYGEENFADNGACIMADGDISLTILFENDAVSSIQYLTKIT